MHGERVAVGPDEPPRAVDDLTLIAAVVGGDREALVHLYDRHAAVLLALAVRMVGDRARAEELVHDVFVAAWHQGRDFDPALGTVRTWLVGHTRALAPCRRPGAVP